MAQAPLEARASAFLEPSVIHRGIWGLPSIFWQRGGQSSRFEDPDGDSYLTGLPRLAILGRSGRNWCPASLPSTDQSGMRMPGARYWAGVNPSFSSSDLPNRLRYPRSLMISTLIPLLSLKWRKWSVSSSGITSEKTGSAIIFLGLRYSWGTNCARTGVPGLSGNAQEIQVLPEAVA